MDIIFIPASLVLGCNNPVAINALSDFIEETTGHPLDLIQTGFSDDVADMNDDAEYFPDGFSDGYQSSNGRGGGHKYETIDGSGGGHGDGHGDGYNGQNGRGYGNGGYNYGRLVIIHNGDGRGNGFGFFNFR